MPTSAPPTRRAPGYLHALPSLADIAVIPPLLAGLDESVSPHRLRRSRRRSLIHTLLPRALKAATRERARYRWLTAVAHSAEGTTYDLDGWRLAPGRRVTFTSGTALSETQIKVLQITQPKRGLPSSAWRCCASSGLQIASQAAGPQPGAGMCGRCARGGRRPGPPVSQGRWLVSLTRWTAANPRPCHWISLMQAEPRYSR
jgi:hypothetical protein